MQIRVPQGLTNLSQYCQWSLLTYSEKSPKFFHTISDKLSELLPNSQKVYIPDASHDMHAENPKVYNEKVMEFLIRHNR